MHIKPYVAAIGAVVVMLAGSTAGAADMDSEQAPQAAPAQDDMMKTGKPAATATVRNTRPKVDRHKDARACLEMANNKAVIKCANKYR
ncbi:MAG TPA: hypothetical protein VF523_18295 [Burkholderiales bacterium]